MASLDAEHSAALRLLRHNRTVRAAVFLLLFAFSYSEDIVAAVLIIRRDNFTGWARRVGGTRPGCWW